MIDKVDQQLNKLTQLKETMSCLISQLPNKESRDFVENFLYLVDRKEIDHTTFNQVEFVNKLTELCQKK